MNTGTESLFELYMVQNDIMPNSPTLSYIVNLFKTFPTLSCVDPATEEENTYSMKSI